MIAGPSWRKMSLRGRSPPGGGYMRDFLKRLHQHFYASEGLQSLFAAQVLTSFLDIAYITSVYAKTSATPGNRRIGV